MKEKKTKKQHYVSRFILDRFTDDKDLLWIYDSKRNRKYEEHPEEEGFINNLYETKFENADLRLGKYVLQNHIEKIFAKYENEFAPILRRLDKKLISQQNGGALICDKSEKNMLRRMIANLYFRTPDKIERLVSDNLEKTLSIEEIKDICDLLDYMGLGGGESLVTASMKTAFLTEEYEEGPIDRFIKWLEGMPFMFLLNPQERFILCDNPVKIGVNERLDSEDKLCVFFPLSPKCAVIFGQHDGIQNNRLKIINEEIADGFVDDYIRMSLKMENKLYFSREKYRDEVLLKMNEGIY